jgi:hypothetical protein
MSISDHNFIGKMLVDEGVITQEQLELVLKEQQKTGELICNSIVKLGFVPEEKIFTVLSRQLNTPYVKLKDKVIDTAVIQKVPFRI